MCECTGALCRSSGGAHVALNMLYMPDRAVLRRTCMVRERGREISHHIYIETCTDKVIRHRSHAAHLPLTCRLGTAHVLCMSRSCPARLPHNRTIGRVCVWADTHIRLNRFPYPRYWAICAYAMNTHWSARRVHDPKVVDSSPRLNMPRDVQMLKKDVRSHRHRIDKNTNVYEKNTMDVEELPKRQQPQPHNVGRVENSNNNTPMAVLGAFPRDTPAKPIVRAIWNYIGRGQTSQNLLRQEGGQGASAASTIPSSSSSSLCQCFAVVVVFGMPHFSAEGGWQTVHRGEARDTLRPPWAGRRPGHLTWGKPKDNRDRNRMEVRMAEQLQWLLCEDHADKIKSSYWIMCWRSLTTVADKKRIATLDKGGYT